MNQSSRNSGRRPQATPSPVRGRCQSYKAGTQKIIDWLASTGARCCDLSTIVNSVHQSRGARHATITLRPIELVTVAQVIAESDDPSIRIPGTVLGILRKVIAGRQECADWYSAQTNASEIQTENETHRHFIKILERTLASLEEGYSRRLMTVAPTQPDTTSRSNEQSNAKPDVVEDDLSDLLASLDVEESDLSLLRNKSEILNGHSSPPPPVVKLENAQHLCDKLLELWCFLRDMYDVRIEVREAWVQYTKGALSFTGASSITDIAFGLLRCANAEFTAFTSLGPMAWRGIMEFLGFGWFTRGKTVWLSSKRGTSSDINPASTGASNMDVVRLMCPAAAVILRTFMQDAQMVCEAHIAAGNGAQRPSTDDVSHTDLHDFHEFSEILRQLTPRLHEVCHTPCGEQFVLDEFIQELIEIHNTLEVPMSMVVSCQIYLDTYDVLNSQVGDAADELGSTLTKHERIATEIASFKGQDKMIDVCDGLDELDSIKKSTIRFEHVTIPSSNLGCAVSAVERALPAHAGAILLDLQVNMHKVGTRLANYGGYVLALAYVYKHLCGMGLLKSVWHDLDSVLPAFGNRAPSFAKNKKSVYDRSAALPAFFVSMGLPPKGFPKEAHRHAAVEQVMNRDMRRMEVTSPLFQALSRRGTREKVLSAYTKSKTIETALHSLTAAAQDTKNGSRATSKSPSNPQVHHEFTPVQLLATLKKLLIADEAVLNFDYAGFMMSCHSLMEKLFSLLHEALGIAKSDNEISNHLNTAKHLLHSEAASTILADAATIFEDHIKTGGNKFIKQAYSHSSGRIPKNAWPQIPSLSAEAVEERETISAIVDHSGTGYAFSGRTMAAYHPGVATEVYPPGYTDVAIDATTPCTSAPDAETDPHAYHHGPRVVRFGAAVPMNILKVAEENGMPIKQLQTEESRIVIELEERNPALRGRVHVVSADDEHGMGSGWKVV